ncbi:MAG: hypothetical protein ACRDYC_13040 [Acidimicrobiales bacterium]
MRLPTVESSSYRARSSPAPLRRYGFGQEGGPASLFGFLYGTRTGQAREDGSGYRAHLGETLIVGAWGLFWLLALIWFAAGQVPSGSSASQYSSLDHLLMFGTGVPIPLLGLVGMGVTLARYNAGVNLLRVAAGLVSGLLVVSLSLALCFLIGLDLAVAGP